MPNTNTDFLRVITTRPELFEQSYGQNYTTTPFITTAYRNEIIHYKIQYIKFYSKNQFMKIIHYK
jgi:hypothetical protein